MDKEDLDFEEEIISEEEIQRNLQVAEMYKKIQQEIVDLGSFDDFRAKNPNLSEEDAAKIYSDMLEKFLIRLGVEAEEGGME